MCIAFGEQRVREFLFDQISLSCLLMCDDDDHNNNNNNNNNEN